MGFGLHEFKVVFVSAAKLQQNSEIKIVLQQEMQIALVSLCFSGAQFAESGGSDAKVRSNIVEVCSKRNFGKLV